MTFEKLWIQAAMGGGQKQGMLPYLKNIAKGRSDVTIDAAASVFEENFRGKCSAIIEEHIENLRHQFKGRFELPQFSADLVHGILLACRRVLIDEGRLKDVFKAIMSIFDVHDENRIVKQDFKLILPFLRRRELRRGLQKVSRRISHGHTLRSYLDGLSIVCVDSY